MDYKSARREFASMLKHQRETLKLTYQELEDRTGVAVPNLVAIAEGRRPIKMDTANLLADVFCLKNGERETFLNLALATHKQARLKASSRMHDPRLINLTADVLNAVGVSSAMVHSCQMIDPGSKQFRDVHAQLLRQLKGGQSQAAMVELQLNNGGVAVGCFVAGKMS